MNLSCKFIVFRNSSFSLKALWKLLKDRVEQVVDDGPHLLVIDDITALLNVGVSVQAIMDFVHYCKVFTTQHVSLVANIYIVLESYINLKVALRVL